MGELIASIVDESNQLLTTSSSLYEARKNGSKANRTNRRKTRKRGKKHIGHGPTSTVRVVQDDYKLLFSHRAEQRMRIEEDIAAARTAAHCAPMAAVEKAKVAATLFNTNFPAHAACMMFHHLQSLWSSDEEVTRFLQIEKSAARIRSYKEASNPLDAYVQACAFRCSSTQERIQLPRAPEALAAKEKLRTTLLMGDQLPEYMLLEVGDNQ